jgi:hypothetical protein
MEQSAKIMRHVVNKDGSLVQLTITETENINHIMIFECQAGDGKLFHVSIDDDGRWVDLEKGRTLFAEQVGAIIEDYYG